MRLISGSVAKRPSLLAAYNGATTQGPPSTYEIGLASAGGDDYPNWYPRSVNPILIAGTGWESQWVAQPCLVWDGSQFVIFYTGYDGTAPQIGRATASDLASSWTKYASNPVVAKGTTGDPDALGAGFPNVLYDPLDTPKWRMWYHAFPAGSSITNPTGLTVCYADSSDGITWTKHGTVIGVGSAGAFNDVGQDNGFVFKSGSTWYVFTAGYHNPGSGIVARSAYCTTTNPASAAAYSAQTQLTNYNGNITVANKTWQSNQPRGIIANPDGHGYLCWLTLWKPTVGTGIVETCVQVSSPDLTSWGLPSALMLPFDSWDTISAENPSVLVAT